MTIMTPGPLAERFVAEPGLVHSPRATRLVLPMLIMLTMMVPSLYESKGTERRRDNGYGD